MRLFGVGADCRSNAGSDSVSCLRCHAGCRADCPDFIVTAAPVYIPLAELRGQERFPKGAQLLMVHAGKAEPLVAGFAASADANISFDGKTVLFAGKQNRGRSLADLGTDA